MRINCSSIFSLGYCDHQDVSMEDLPILYRLWAKDNKWGHIFWIMIKRKELPLKEIENSLISIYNLGSYELKENQYEKMLRNNYD